jgi:transcriptional regulator with XRE-family HTH domain
MRHAARLVQKLEPVQDSRPGTMNGIGERIRELRKKRGLTLQALGERIGLSSSYLSQVENSRANVTLDTLQAIAFELSVHIVDLFPVDDITQVSIMRSSDRRSYSFKGVGTEHLLFGSNRTALQVAVIELPGGATYPVADSHPGDEFTYVLVGKLCIRLGEDLRYELDTGDIIYYRSTLPHRWENPGPEPVRFMVVNTPASF